MTDYGELVERMRAYPANKLCIQIANALEAQAQEISQYQVDVNEALLDCKSLRARIAELEVALDSCVNALDFAQEYFSDVDVVAIKDALEEARAALKGDK
jgi:hypothetical protein